MPATSWFVRFQNYIATFLYQNFFTSGRWGKKAFPSTVLRREKKSARFCCCTPAALRSFDKMRGRAPKGLLCIKGCNFFSTRSFRVASTIVACSSIVPLYCCHYRLRHAAACGAALVNRLSKRYSPLQQDDSNLNFLSSFLMRALMHMRGSRLSQQRLLLP